MPRNIRLNEKVIQLRTFWRKEHRPPSSSEMMALFGYKSKNSVFGLVRHLEQGGYLVKAPDGKLSFLPKLTGGVSNLGTIAAGFPTQEEEQKSEAISLDEYLVRDPEHTYMLTVRGDSMIDAGIEDGDIVVCRKQISADEGDIVVALVDGESTLKRFFIDRKKKCFILHPENEEYEDIIVEELYIQGVATHVIKKLGNAVGL